MEHADASARKALVLLSGGGHLIETLLLLRKMAGSFKFDYIVVGYGGPRTFEDLPKGDVYKMVSLSNFSQNSRIRDIHGLAVGFVQCWRIMRKSRPDVVVGVGTNNVVPLFLAAKILGVKRIFVESITRVETPSLTARIVGFLGIADRLYVQWPELVGKVKGAAYRGNII